MERTSIPPDVDASDAPSAATDAELLKRYIHHRDQDAFETLVNRYSSAVYATCRRQLRDPAGADDATQATFLVLERRASKLVRDRIPMPLVAWLMRTALLVCANATRDRRRRHHHELAAGSLVSSNHPTEDVDRESSVDIVEMISRLSPAYRDVVTMRYLLGRSCEDIAKELGLEVEAVNKRLSRGLALLRTRAGLSSQSSIAVLLLGLQDFTPPAAFDPLARSPRALRLADSTQNWTVSVWVSIAAAVAALVGISALIIIRMERPDHPRESVTTTPERGPRSATPYGLRAGDSKLIDAFCVCELVASGDPSARLPLLPRVVEYSVFRVDVQEATADQVRVSYVPILVTQWKPMKTTRQEDVRITGDDGVVRVVSFTGTGATILSDLPQPITSIIGPGARLTRYPNSSRIQPTSYELSMADLGLPVWLPPIADRSHRGFKDAVSMQFDGADFVGSSISTGADRIVYSFPDTRLRDFHFPYRLLVDDMHFMDAAGSGVLITSFDGPGDVPSSMHATWTFDLKFHGSAELDGVRATLHHDAQLIDVPADRITDPSTSLLLQQRLAKLTEDPSDRLRDAPEWAADLARATAFASLRWVSQHGIPPASAPEVISDFSHATPRVPTDTKSD
jgi:RNA polymerase sigma factor (sigma-70 family)